MKTPQYEHDSICCTFIPTDDTERDWYVCGTTIIGRESSEGCEYLAFDVLDTPAHIKLRKDLYDIPREVMLVIGHEVMHERYRNAAEKEYPMPKRRSITPPTMPDSSKSDWLLRADMPEVRVAAFKLIAEQLHRPCPYCGSTTKTYDEYRGYDACDGCGVI